MFEEVAVWISLLSHIFFTSNLVFISLKPTFIFLFFWYQMQVAMRNCLTCFFTILTKYLVLYFVNLLQFTTYLVSSHEKINSFYLCKILHFWSFSLSTDKNMTRWKRFMIDHSIYIFPKKKDLRRRYDILSKNDLPSNLHWYIQKILLIKKDNNLIKVLLNKLNYVRIIIFV